MCHYMSLYFSTNIVPHVKVLKTDMGGSQIVMENYYLCLLSNHVSSGTPDIRQRDDIGLRMIPGLIWKLTCNCYCIKGI